MFEEIVNKSSSKHSNLRLYSAVFNPDYGHIELEIHGGLNGWGKWRDYISDILDLIDNLEEIYKNVWIYDFLVDSLDDVFTVKIAVKDAIED